MLIKSLPKKLNFVKKSLQNVRFIAVFTIKPIYLNFAYLETFDRKNVSPAYRIELVISLANFLILQSASG